MLPALDVYEDEVKFAAAVGPWLAEHEAENSMFLGMLERLKDDRPGSTPFMMRATSDGNVTFAAMYREINLIVTRGPDEVVDATVAKLAASGINVPGVIGPAKQAERFARSWAKDSGGESFRVIEQRIYQLTDIIWPAPAEGRMRPVLPGDLELVVEWSRNFDIETMLRSERRTLDEARSKVAKRLSEGNLFGWECEGRLVSMAGLARPTANTISVNSVYTPPTERRRGFASALVAAVSQEGLNRGKAACVLYTELANPISNSIYQRIGYQAVCDAKNCIFQEH